jgi:thioredoxin reductase (NADPH)
VFRQSGALGPVQLEELITRIKEFDVDSAVASQEN